MSERFSDKWPVERDSIVPRQVPGSGHGASNADDTVGTGSHAGVGVVTRSRSLKLGHGSAGSCQQSSREGSQVRSRRASDLGTSISSA